MGLTKMVAEELPEEGRALSRETFADEYSGLSLESRERLVGESLVVA